MNSRAITGRWRVRGGSRRFVPRHDTGQSDPSSVSGLGQCEGACLPLDRVGRSSGVRRLAAASDSRSLAREIDHRRAALHVPREWRASRERAPRSASAARTRVRFMPPVLRYLARER